MIKQLHLIKCVDDLNNAIERIKRAGFVAVDTETTALDPLDGRLRLIQLAVQEGEVSTAWIIDFWEWSEISLRALADVLTDESIIKIAHNAKFEIKWLTKKILEPTTSPRAAGWFCTMLASTLASTGNHSHEQNLKSVVFRYLGIELDKTQQTSDWSGKLSSDQLSYAAEDVYVLLPLHKALAKELMRQDQTRVMLLEMQALITIAEAEVAGIYVDRQRWGDLLEQKIIYRNKLKEGVTNVLQAGVNWTSPNPDKRGKRPTKPKKSYKKPIKPKKPSNAALQDPVIKQAYHEAVQAYEDVKTYYEHQQELFQYEQTEWQGRFNTWHSLPDGIVPVVNLNSPDQVRKALTNIGVELGEHKTNEKELNEILQQLRQGGDAAIQQINIIELLLEYRGAEKAVTSYGANVLDAIKIDQRLHPAFQQIGAAQTGRMSCKSPNVQQIPRDEHHRRCIKAQGNRKLIIADYPQIELRVLAELSRDENFIGDFNSGLDMHTAGASRFFGVRYDDVTKAQRQDAKAVNFHVIYGGGSQSLSVRIGKAENETQALLDGYFAAYPKNKLYMEIASAQARDKGFSRTMSGRLIRYDITAAKQAGSWGLLNAFGRNGMNAPIQGTSCDMFKRAIYYVGKGLWNMDAKAINFIHDEIVVECNAGIADEVGAIVKECMERAASEFLSVVDCNVDVVIADEWMK